MTLCFFNGCDAPVDASDGWRCFFHRSRGRCAVETCRNQAYARQRCARHGGKRQCRFTGCTFRSRTGAYCSKHGGSTRAVRVCLYGDCPNKVQKSGLCTKHGGGRHCKMAGCTTFARRGGFCARHTRLLSEQVAPTPNAATNAAVDIVDLTLDEVSGDDLTIWLQNYEYWWKTSHVSMCDATTDNKANHVVP